MENVTMRELRNDGGRVIDRVVAGEEFTVTRDGRPVAKLVPLPRRRLSREELVERFGRLPSIDAEQFRQDVDSVVDQSV